MSRYVKPFVPLAVPVPLPLPELCPCVVHDAHDCLANRHANSMALAEILGGCPCSCHCTKDGAVMPVQIWYKVRAAKQRDRERTKLLNESRSQFGQAQKKESI